MILLADSGSTKTSWWLINEGTRTGEYFTAGINPFYQSGSDIAIDLQLNLQPKIDAREIQHVYFYGAGCHFEDKKQIVRTGLRSVLQNAVIEINNDLLGTCRALFGNEPGIACILGTGSNSCFYDGKEIKENVSPLGFILGDEGSGAVLGKLLIGNMLKKQLSEELQQKFFEKYNVTTADVLDNVYKKPFPNRYLAQFSAFLYENIEHKSIYSIVYKSFEDFFVRNVMQYDYKHYPIGFTGSVAYYFKDVLGEVATDLHITLAKIERSPMEGLFRHHTK